MQTPYSILGWLRSCHAQANRPDGSPNKDWCFTRGQLYVDDTAFVLGGTDASVSEGIDILLLWWMLIGCDLAWSKGSVLLATEPHTWIGVQHHWTGWAAVMELPPKFLEELLKELAPFATGKGKTTLSIAERVVGRCARVAHVIPQARPFAGAMYAALSASKASQSVARREAPPGMVALQRFAHGARWFVALIRGGDEAPLCLQATVHPSSRTLPSSQFRILFDASVWGAGAVLVDAHGVPAGVLGQRVAGQRRRKGRRRDRTACTKHVGNFSPSSSVYWCGETGSLSTTFSKSSATTQRHSSAPSTKRGAGP